MVGSVFFRFLKIGFSFTILEPFEKTFSEIGRLQSTETRLANMLAPTVKKPPESFSTLATLQLPIFVIVFDTFSSEVLFKEKSSEIVKLG